jgi:hypothetical protein
MSTEPPSKNAGSSTEYWVGWTSEKSTCCSPGVWDPVLKAEESRKYLYLSHQKLFVETNSKLAERFPTNWRFTYQWPVEALLGIVPNRTSWFPAAWVASIAWLSDHVEYS